MNKKNLWFLTLFSLILILGVYYITLPSEIFSDKYNTDKVNKNIDINVSENNKLVALRVERDEKVADLMSKLQEKIVSPLKDTLGSSSTATVLEVTFKVCCLFKASSALNAEFSEPSALS